MDLESPSEQFEDLCYQVLSTGSFVGFDAIIQAIDSITTADVQSVSSWFTFMYLSFLSIIMSTPLGGGHIIFAFSAVRRPTWFPDILGNSSYPIFTKFGMQVYWVNSLYGIAFGDDSSIAN